MLYGDIKTAGDPLGYLPKGLRSRVNVVDTATTNAGDQQKLMEAYADGTLNRPGQTGAGMGAGVGASPHLERAPS